MIAASAATATLKGITPSARKPPPIPRPFTQFRPDHVEDDRFLSLRATSITPITATLQQYWAARMAQLMSGSKEANPLAADSPTDHQGKMQLLMQDASRTGPNDKEETEGMVGLSRAILDSAELARQAFRARRLLAVSVDILCAFEAVATELFRRLGASCSDLGALMSRLWDTSHDAWEYKLQSFVG